MGKLARICRRRRSLDGGWTAEATAARRGIVGLTAGAVLQVYSFVL